MVKCLKALLYVGMAASLHAADPTLTLERAARIARFGSFEVDCRDGEFHSRRSPEYLSIHGLPPGDINDPHEAWVRRLHPDAGDVIVVDVVPVPVARGPDVAGRGDRRRREALPPWLFDGPPSRRGRAQARAARLSTAARMDA